MMSVNIRKQGGAAVMTIPSDMLKALDLQIGSLVTLDIADGDLVVRSSRPKKKRLTLKELLQGITPKTIEKMRTETEWAREGNPTGRELI